MNTDDIDKFGHCVVCHKNLLTKRVVDGKVLDMFLPIYSDTMFLLSNGSQMQVTICKPCKEITNLSDPKTIENIWAVIQKGWQLETQLKVDTSEMTPEVREKMLDDVGKLTIDCHSEHLTKYAIQERVIQIRNLKVEELSESNSEIKEEVKI